MKYNINLLEKEGLSAFERITYFFSNYLRYILVITQLVVIGVLFYRFRIDQSIIDLKELIDQKKQIINVTASLVNESKKIDLKTKGVTGILNDQKNVQEMINYILSSFPRDVFLTRLELENNSLKLTGDTPNPRLLQVYFEKLKKDGRFKSITLNDVKKNESGFTFTLSLNNFISSNK